MSIISKKEILVSKLDFDGIRFDLYSNIEAGAFSIIYNTEMELEWFSNSFINLDPYAPVAVFTRHWL